MIAMRADIRLWAAIAIIAICGFSITQGWKIVQFSVARTRVNIDAAENRTGTLSKWTAVSGLASAALHAELTDQINTSDIEAANRKREALSLSLSINPMFSFDWLLLSGMQLVTDRPMEQVLRSLELSILTGPNEGQVMAERGIFGVSLWESLSPALKNRAALDLAPMIFPRTPAEGAEGEKFRTVIATKSALVRKELRTALLAIGLSPKAIEQQLGF
jgi:hypothetical protein